MTPAEFWLIFDANREDEPEKQRITDDQLYQLIWTGERHSKSIKHKEAAA